MKSEIEDLIKSNQSMYKSGASVEHRNKIPSQTSGIPKDGNHWLRIDDVLCVYIDMKDSTRLSAAEHENSTANIYRYFTRTAVDILNYFDANYVDVRGDGAFGLFNKKNFYHGMCSAITFVTFARKYLNKVKVNNESVSCHIGSDMGTVLVKQVGLRKNENDTWKKNEVWAGKPVNMASKLSSIGSINDYLISESVKEKIDNDTCEKLLYSCGCGNDGESTNAWSEVDLENNDIFNFSKAHKLTVSGWCDSHGDDYLDEIISYDE